MSSGRFIALLFILIGAKTMAIEEPDFEVLPETADYEIRHYSPYLVAEVDVERKFGEAGNEAFRILAAYIFGENVPGEKMQLTAPVESHRIGKGIRMAMTAPVLSRETESGADSFTYGFVMERKYTMDTLPKPKDRRIELRRQEPRFVAARRYSGDWTETNRRANESQVLSALKAVGLEYRSEPILARYNSPFTPPFPRRNEVLIEIDVTPHTSARQRPET